MAKLAPQTIERMKRAKLSIKQERFVADYARNGNASRAARAAGYKPKAARQMGSENLSKPAIKVALGQELARIEADYSPNRVKRRLHEISYEAQNAGQFGPAVRSEELLGKAAGMWSDQSIILTGQLSDAHISALLELAKRRSTETVDNGDDDNA